MEESIRYIMGALGVFGILALVMAGARNLRAGLAVVTLIVFFSSISTQVEGRGHERVGRTWLQLFQANRAELYLAMSCALGMILAANARFMQMTRVSGIAMIMLIINIFAGVLDARSDAAQGAMRVGLAAISITSMALFVTSMVRTWDDLLPLMRALGVSGLMWVGGALVQVLLDKSQMLVNYETRFLGLLGNPQGTAIYLGPQSAITLWLMLNDSKRWTRILWAAVYAVILMLVVWTGSRTGMLMTIMGAMALLRSRFKNAVFLLPVLAVALVGVAYLVDSLGIELPFKRFLEGGDTRSEAWRGLFEDAQRSGVFGLGLEGARFVENSYLYAWVVYGPIMLALLLLQLVVIGTSSFRLWSVRREVPFKVRSMVDLTIAYYAMFFVGAQFEWFILARVDANISYVVIFSCIANAMLAMVREQRTEPAYAGEHDQVLAIEYREEAPHGT